MEKKRSDILKIIAILTMLIDHIGYLFFPDQVLWRVIGRISFPIFAYLVALGAFRTRNVYRYGGRLLAFALVSQIPYNYMAPGRLNIFFTLLAGVLMVRLFESKYQPVALFFPIIGEFLQLSYGAYGLIMILFFHIWKDKPRAILLAYLGLTALSLVDYGGQVMDLLRPLTAEYGLWTGIYKLLSTSWGWVQSCSVLALPLILLEDRIAIPVRLPKWLGYGFYPLHIALLVYIRSRL